MPLIARNFNYADNERLMNGSSHFHPWEGEGGWPEKRLCYLGEEALFSFSSWWKTLCSPGEVLLFWCNDPCFRDEFVVCSDENNYFMLTCVIMVYSAITLFIWKRAPGSTVCCGQEMGFLFINAGGMWLNMHLLLYCCVRAAHNRHRYWFVQWVIVRPLILLYTRFSLNTFRLFFSFRW